MIWPVSAAATVAFSTVAWTSTGTGAIDRNFAIYHPSIMLVGMRNRSTLSDSKA